MFVPNRIIADNLLYQVPLSETSMFLMDVKIQTEASDESLEVDQPFDCYGLFSMPYVPHVTIFIYFFLLLSAFVDSTDLLVAGMLIILACTYILWVCFEPEGEPEPELMTNFEILQVYLDELVFDGVTQFFINFYVDGYKIRSSFMFHDKSDDDLYLDLNRKPPRGIRFPAFERFFMPKYGRALPRTLMFFLPNDMRFKMDREPRLLLAPSTLVADTRVRQYLAAEPVTRGGEKALSAPYNHAVGVTNPLEAARLYSTFRQMHIGAVSKAMDF